MLEDDDVSASKFHLLNAKWFSVQITALTIRQLLAHWITVRANSGLQHRQECASRLCDSLLICTNYSFQSVKMLFFLQLHNIVDRRWRARLVKHNPPTATSKKPAFTRSNKDQLAIIAVCTHVYTSTHA